jgi:ribosomal subunit interface protein
VREEGAVMNVIVQSKTLAISDGLRQCIDRQSRKLNKLGIKIDKVRIFLENLAKKKNDTKSAQVTYAVALPGKKEVVVMRRAADMYEAIVDATNRVMRQVREEKEKRIAIHRKRLLT